MMGNSSHPFLDPLWRRVLLVGSCFAWSALEFYYQSNTWGMMVGIFAIYGAWSYLFAYVPALKAETNPAAKEE